MVFFSSPRFPSENLDLELVRIAFPVPARDRGVFLPTKTTGFLSTIIKLQRGGGRWKVVVYLRFPSKKGRVYMICRSNAWCTMMMISCFLSKNGVFLCRSVDAPRGTKEDWCASLAFFWGDKSYPVK